LKLIDPKQFGGRQTREEALTVFRHALVRPPGSNFADGLTTVDLGVPDHDRALEQHAAYCVALEHCGLIVTHLEEDTHHPDSTFVEDTVILTPSRAILTRPGAASRAGEVSAIRAPLSVHYREITAVSGPGTLDGGDVCEADGHFIIGISHRTSEQGAHELADILAENGHTSTFVDIRAVEGILHLKSGIAYVGDGRMVAIPSLAHHPMLRSYEVICVESPEAYAANCVRVNDQLLVAAGYPRLEAVLRRLGHDLVPLKMSEFQKMDGGLSCLSLRF
jgi:dimethylargininase